MQYCIPANRDISACAGGASGPGGRCQGRQPAACAQQQPPPGGGTVLRAHPCAVPRAAHRSPGRALRRAPPHPAPHLDQRAICALGHNHEQPRARGRVVGVGGVVILRQRALRRQRAHGPAGGGAGGWTGPAARRGAPPPGRAAAAPNWSKGGGCNRMATLPARPAIQADRRPPPRCLRGVGRAGGAPGVGGVGQDDLEPGALPIIERDLVQVLDCKGCRRRAVVLHIGHTCGGQGTTSLPPPPGLQTGRWPMAAPGPSPPPSPLQLRAPRGPRPRHGPPRAPGHWPVGAWHVGAPSGMAPQRPPIACWRRRDPDGSSQAGWEGCSCDGRVSCDLPFSLRYLTNETLPY